MTLFHIVVEYFGNIDILYFLFHQYQILAALILVLLINLVLLLILYKSILIRDIARRSVVDWTASLIQRQHFGNIGEIAELMSHKDDCLIFQKATKTVLKDTPPNGRV